MKITDVQTIILRQPTMDVSKADGRQDALLIRIETDAGISGIGEVDSLPPVVKAIVDAPRSHAIASGLRHLLLGSASAGDRQVLPCLRVLDRAPKPRSGLSVRWDS